VNTFEKCDGGRMNVHLRRKAVLASAASLALAAVLSSSSARAASATWTGGTNSVWEAAGTENNWSTGAATFPGTTTVGSILNADVATFNSVVTNSTISINSTAGNSSSLNFGGMTFTGATVSNFTIGSTTGNVLVGSSDSSQSSAAAAHEIVISGSGRSGAGPSSLITETINSPVVIAPLTSTTAGFYTFQNNSTVNSSGDKLIFNGAISGGSTNAGVTLTLRGASINTGNAVNGNISDGSATGPVGTGGLQLFKSDAGTWTLSGANTYTGPTTIQNGILRITGSYSGGGAVTFSGSTAGTLLIQTTGTATFGNIGLNQANSSVNVTSGTLIAGSISENAASASRHVDLNGGILDLTADYGAIPGVLNLNGGTLANDKTGSATLTIDSWLTNVATTHNINVQAGGGTFDTTLGNITSLAPLNGTTGGTVNVIGGNTFKSGSSTAANTFVMSVGGTSTWDYNGLASTVGGLTGSGNVTNSGTAVALTDGIASGTQTFSGSIGGGGNVSFIKSGAGTQVLSGSNSFTGTTAVNAGALIVTGSTTGSTVTVNSTGVLAGNGNGTTTGLLGNVVLASGSTLMPGTANADGSIGTMTMASLDATNGGTGSTGAVRFDLVSPGASDLINVSGTATFSASNTFTLLGTPIAGTYTLVSAGTLAGTQPTLSFPTGTRSTFTPHYGDVTSGANAFTIVVTGNADSLFWTGASTAVWNLVGDTNWTDGTNPQQFYNLDSVMFTNGAAHESITLNSTVQPSSVTVNNDSIDPYSISGTGSITGTGTTLTKQGTGTLVLATSNSYGGTTTISGGVLQVGNGGAVGSLGAGVITLSNNATLAFNLSGSTTLSTAVNGSGLLHQMGPGMLIITSSNNYSGNTTIDSGATLQLGNGGATGNLGITSDITDNGTLIFNRNNASTISAPISGNGSLQVTAGTLSLGANNSYMGTTTIANGATLQVGSGGTTGSVGAGALTNNGTLAFNRSDTVSVPALGGSGGIQQNGTGTLALSAAGSYMGATTINSGTLAALNANSFGNTSGITIAGANATLSLRGDSNTTFAPPSSSTPFNVSMTTASTTIDVNQATVAGTAAKTMTIGNIDASTSTTTSLTINFTGANSTGLTAGSLLGPASASAGNIVINNTNTSGTTTLVNYQSNNTSGNDTLTFQGAGNTTLTGGIMYGPTDVNVVANGPGTLTILGASDYTLTTVITNGAVAIGNDNAFGQSSVNLNAPDPAVGILESADSNTRTISNPIINSSTNFTFGGTGNLVFTGPWNKGQFAKNLIVNNPMVTISGQVSNSGTANGGFSKSGPGILVLNAGGGNLYTCDTYLFGGTLVAASSGGSATGSGNVYVYSGVLAGDTLTNLPSGASISGNVEPGSSNPVALANTSGPYTIAPGGIGSIGIFNIGGLVSNNNTTLNFDVGTGAGIVTNGDLLTLGGGTVIVGANTAISIGGTTASGNDYRLIGGSISGINLSNFSVPAAPSGQDYALSTSVDSGYIDLIVGIAQNLVWSGATAVWDVSTTPNWNASVATFLQGDNVTFDNTVGAGSKTVTINTAVKPGSVAVNGSQAYIFNGTGGIAGPATLTKSGTGSLTLSTSNTYTGGTIVTGGTLTIASTTALPTASVLSVSSGATVVVNRNGGGKITLSLASLSDSGLIDLQNNLMVISGSNANAATYTTINNLLKSGFTTNQNWSGTTGITTSTLGGNSLYTLGEALVGSTLTVGYAYYGDADMSGHVDGTDYSLIDTGFGSGGTLTGWQNGDFNYDGFVDGSDYSLIDNAFNTQLATVPAAQIAVNTSEIAGGSAAVPEPASLGLLGIGAMGLTSRRRRRD
jgi:fibronectin-binding autotransporter adhesin